MQNKIKTIYLHGSFIHHKNKIGLELLKNEDISILPYEENKDLINTNNNDYVVICTDEINLDIINKHQKVIIGPHIELMDMIEQLQNYKNNKQIFVNMLCNWNNNIVLNYVKNTLITPIALPFPVDIEKFKPVEKIENKFFIYFKRRHFINLILVSNLVKNIGKPVTFIYGKYQEEEYRKYISDSKFGIWIGCHESQGFALEEALSSDCPLFVVDVNSMKDEFNGKKFVHDDKIYQNDYATSAQYFDESCGMKCTNITRLKDEFYVFLKNVNDSKYFPRKYVLNNLTTKQFVENINKVFK